MTEDVLGQQNNTRLEIAATCDSIKELLMSKNMKYGDSALSPTRLFSQASALEQLFVRIDDKLSRISRGAGLLASDEDVLDDLIGYLVLTKIALSREAKDKIDYITFRDEPKSSDSCLPHEWSVLEDQVSRHPLRISD